MNEYLPKPYVKFQESHPDVAKAFESLGKACHEAGPLKERTRHLIKLGISVAQESEGAVRSHVRQALEAGSSEEEIRHAILLALTTSGFPGMIAALGWADEVFEARTG